MKDAMKIGLVIASLLLPAGLMAASNKCEVLEVDGKRLILECERDNAQLQPGDRVKLKTARKNAQVEGC